MKPFVELALLAVTATAMCGQAHAGADGAPAIAATPGAPSFDVGRIVPPATVIAAPSAARSGLPRGARSLFALQTKLRGKTVLLHVWNPVKGDGHIDILAPVKTKSRTTYQRLNRVTMERLESSRYTVRLAPLRAGKPGWAMAVNWTPAHAAGAFARVPMRVFVAQGGDGGRVIKQVADTESSAGGNEFFDLRTDRNGAAFLMLHSESFDAQTKTLRPYRWNGAMFINSGQSRTLPL